MAETFISGQKPLKPEPRNLAVWSRVSSLGNTATLLPPSGHWLQVLLLLSRIWKVAGQAHPLAGGFGSFRSPAIPDLAG